MFYDFIPLLENRRKCRAVLMAGSLLTAFMFTGCGGGGGNSDNEPELSIVKTVIDTSNAQNIIKTVESQLSDAVMLTVNVVFTPTSCSYGGSQNYPNGNNGKFSFNNCAESGWTLDGSYYREVINWEANYNYFAISMSSIDMQIKEKGGLSTTVRGSMKAGRNYDGNLLKITDMNTVYTNQNSKITFVGGYFYDNINDTPQQIVRGEASFKNQTENIGIDYEIRASKLGQCGKFPYDGIETIFGANGTKIEIKYDGSASDQVKVTLNDTDTLFSGTCAGFDSWVY
ncbi:MAG: hypothetical protein LBG21_00275 [Campylobacteraceae bacterium]|nr:hypothetical protein [Campylobacteraceae bacterium]